MLRNVPSPTDEVISPVTLLLVLILSSCSGPAFLRVHGPQRHINRVLETSPVVSPSTSTMAGPTDEPPIRNDTPVVVGESPAT
nr:unnamed protein product [Digitaria exilis]